MYSIGTLSGAQVVMSIVIALASNAVFKVVLLRSVGGSAIFRRCFPAIAVMVIGAAAGIFIEVS
jgi:hypothetical protein